MRPEQPIVCSDEPVTLIGGADVADDALDRALRRAPVVVAADGGADAALARGLIPQAVIGDFDSISADARAALPAATLHRVAEQDSTDFDKCLGRIAAPLVIGVGFSGARLDHQMAVCNALVRRAGQRCILLGDDDLVFLAPPSLCLPLTPGCRVSLFPMAAVEGVSDGLHWPIGGLVLSPDGMVGTSNRATGPVQLTVTAPKLLVILPAARLDRVVTALLATAARW